MRGHKRGSGERSNSYSESKLSNWEPYDPFESEISALPLNMRPADQVACSDAEASIPVFARETHSSFLRPCEPSEIADVLRAVPQEYLDGLDMVCVLGGTNKQEKASTSRLFRYGCYQWGEIYLHAFPKRILTRVWASPPRPSTVEEYRRAGATIEMTKQGWSMSFCKDSLRRFYLYDVLLHELGHHVEFMSGRKLDSKSSERYADWFAQYSARSLDRAAGDSETCS